jgi:hypothetical protein
MYRFAVNGPAFAPLASRSNFLFVTLDTARQLIRIPGDLLSSSENDKKIIKEL